MDGGGDYPVHGAIKVGDIWEVRRWMLTGRWLSEASETFDDLIEVKPKRKLTGYINVYEGYNAVHTDEGKARYNRKADCIASLTREIEYEVGEGL